MSFFGWVCAVGRKLRQKGGSDGSGLRTTGALNGLQCTLHTRFKTPTKGEETPELQLRKKSHCQNDKREKVRQTTAQHVGGDTSANVPGGPGGRSQWGREFAPGKQTDNRGTRRKSYDQEKISSEKKWTWKSLDRHALSLSRYKLARYFPCGPRPARKKQPSSPVFVHQKRHGKVKTLSENRLRHAGEEKHVHEASGSPKGEPTGRFSHPSHLLSQGSKRLQKRRNNQREKNRNEITDSRRGNFLYEFPFLERLSGEREQ